MFKFNVPSFLVVLAMLASTNAMAQFTLGEAEVVVEKTTLRCNADTNCAVRVGKANHFKSAKCVLYKPTSTVKVCEFEKYVCDDENAYTNDYFDAVNKTCAFVNPPCVTDLECEDGDGCTVDYCGWNGSCYSYERWNCTPCNEDTDCMQEVQTECVQSTESSWTEGCMPDNYCDRVWSESAYCVNGCDDADYMCLQDQDIECQDGDPCTVDSFNTTSQTCENVPSQDGVLCDDGVWCTYEDYCMGGECAPGEDYSDVYCSDNNPCTVDTCLGNNYGCSNTFKTCDDANACTMDSCNGATGGCVNTVKTCSDGNACTVDSCLATTGACSNQAKNCDDVNICTLDSCNPTNGLCSNVAKCDDGKPETNDSCVTATGECINTIPPVSGKQANLVNKTSSDYIILVACNGSNPNFSTTKKTLIIAANATYSFTNVNSCWAEIVIPSPDPSWFQLGTFEARLAKWQTIFKITDGSGQEIAPIKPASGYDIEFVPK